MPPPRTSNQAESETDLRTALHWSMASVVWTVAASTAAVVAGITAGSLLLVVFGSIGALDAAGSVVLVLHFRHALHHEAISGVREHRALLVIASGMAAIALATAVESVHRLARHGASTEFSAVGTGVAGASIVVLAVLATAKHRIGDRVGSRALVADSQVSGLGAVLALCTCAGTAASDAFDWWWLDPAGSLVVALIAVGFGFGHLRRS
jgi:divalent metal cation (Fe/Co/Zn/Cd) transporter